VILAKRGPPYKDKTATLIRASLPTQKHRVLVAVLATFLLVEVALLYGCASGGSTETPGILPPPTPQPKVALFQLPTADSFDAGITAGPDGNIWFVEGAINVNQIGRIRIKDGSITEFPLSGCGTGGEYIAPGSDGNVWASQFCFTNHNPPMGYPEMAVVAPDGSMRLIQMNTSEQPFRGALGPDGNVWFTLPHHGMIGKITTQGVATQYSLSTPLEPNPLPESLTPGPGGNIWVVEEGPYVDEVSTNGTILNQFNSPFSGTGIALGPDGNLWIAGYDSDVIEKMTTNGVTTTYPIQNPCEPGFLTGPLSIAAGADGAMWFTESLGQGLGRIDMAGNMSTICLGVAGFTWDVTSGPDSNIWFTATGLNAIGEVLIRHQEGTENRSKRASTDASYDVCASRETLCRY